MGVRLGDGQGEDRLEAREERSQIVHTFSVSYVPGHELVEEPAGTPPREAAGRVGGWVAPAASWARPRSSDEDPGSAMALAVGNKPPLAHVLVPPRWKIQNSVLFMSH